MYKKENPWAVFVQPKEYKKGCFGGYSTQVVLLKTHWGSYDYKITPWCYYEGYDGMTVSSFWWCFQKNSDVYKKIKKMAEAYCAIHEGFEVICMSKEDALKQKQKDLKENNE